MDGPNPPSVTDRVGVSSGGGTPSGPVASAPGAPDHGPPWRTGPARPTQAASGGDGSDRRAAAAGDPTTVSATRSASTAADARVVRPVPPLPPRTAASGPHRGTGRWSHGRPPPTIDTGV